MVDSRWIEWKDADRFDTYPAPISCALGWVALLLDFHLSRYQISLGPSLFIPLPSNTDGSSIPNRRVCARWLGRARNRRSNGRYRSIPPPPRYVLPPRWNDVLFCVNRPPYLFIHRRRHSNMISCTSSSSSKLLSHRSATSYNMTKHGKELEKKRLNEEVELLLLPVRVCSTIRIGLAFLHEQKLKCGNEKNLLHFQRWLFLLTLAPYIAIVKPLRISSSCRWLLFLRLFIWYLLLLERFHTTNLGSVPVPDDWNESCVSSFVWCICHGNLQCQPWMEPIIVCLDSYHRPGRPQTWLWWQHNATLIQQPPLTAFGWIYSSGKHYNFFFHDVKLCPLLPHFPLFVNFLSFHSLNNLVSKNHAREGRRAVVPSFLSLKPFFRFPAHAWSSTSKSTVESSELSFELFRAWGEGGD